MRPREPRASSAASDGSVLVESLVGLGLLALIIVSIAGVHGAVVAATVRAEARQAALEAAEYGLGMVTVLGPHAFAEGLAIDGLDILVRSGMDRDDPCAAPEVPDATAAIVGVSVASQARTPIPVDDVVSLVGALEGDSTVRVHVPAAVPDASATTLVHIGGGSPPVPLALPSAGIGIPCASGSIPEPGRYEVRLAAAVESQLVDATQQDYAEAPLLVSAVDRTVRRAIGGSLGASLTVDVANDGARHADVVIPSELRWWVRGDAGRIGTPLGSSRWLHPGEVQVVVSPCENPEERSTWASVTLEPGGSKAVVLPLATVTLIGTAGLEQHTLELVRVRECADGSVRRAEMHWQGALTDGLRIFLPHGHWEGFLRSPQGRRARGVIVVKAGLPDQIVSLS